MKQKESFREIKGLTSKKRKRLPLTAGVLLLPAFLPLQVLMASGVTNASPVCNIQVVQNDTTITATPPSKPGTISGKVTDTNGHPIMGVSVILKGSGVGAQTGNDGTYSINVPTNSGILRFACIGYGPVETPITQSTMNVEMKVRDTKLGEVVVTAMGIARKAETLTYATQTVGGDELTRAKESNLINSLQGKSAGLVITPNSGGAGSASKILLRGNASMLGNNSPLIVLDGVPMTNSVQNQLGLDGGSSLMSGATEGGDALSQLNPDDIESITVLKGANSAALYGSAASNGVLMITTKKGKQGSMRIDVSSSTTFETPLVLPKLQSVYGSAIGGSEANGFSIGGNSWGGKLSAMTASQLANTNGVQHLTNSAYDVSDFFRTGTNYNNSISFSGGTEKVQSYFSYGNTTANGIMEKNHFSRNNIALRENFSLFKDKLKINIAGNFINEKTKNRPESGMYSTLANLYTASRNADLNYYKNNYQALGSWTTSPYFILSKETYMVDGTPTEIFTDQQIQTTLTGEKQKWYLQDAVGKNNPWWLMNKNQSEEISNHIFGNFGATYEIYKDLNVQARMRYDYQENRSEARQYATTMRPSDMNERGRLIWQKDFNRTFYGDFLLNYSHTFIDEWTLRATFGGSMMNSHSNYWKLTPTASSGTPYQEDKSFNQFVLSDIYINGGNGSDVTGGGLESQNWERSLFATASLSFRNIANLDGSYRSDWYRAFTQFPNLNKSYPYYSIGGNIIVNNIWDLPEVINELKIRGSYSQVGNSIPNSLFLASAHRNPATGAYISSGTTDFRNAKPETTASSEVGFDLSMFNHALNMDFTYYHAVMSNQFMSYAGKGGKTVYTNSGKVRNQGIEYSVSYRLDPGNGFTWKTGVNFSYNVNKILSTAKKEDGTDLLREVDLGNGSGLKIKFLPGGSYGDLYATDYVRNADGTIRINKTTGRPFIDQANSTHYLGNMNAKVNLGWNNTFTYKDFQFYFLIDGKIGGKVVSFTEAFLDYYGVSQRTADARLNAERNGIKWTSKKGIEYPGMYMPDGQITSIQSYYEATSGATPLGSNYVYSGTNFRMREISFGYTFRDLFGMSKNLTISATGRNLFFIYKDAPIDPETSMTTQNALGNVDIFSQPTTRQFGITIKATF